MMNSDKEELLRSIYRDARHPSGLASAEKLFKSAKLISPSLTIAEVKGWLKGETTHTLHRQARRFFPRKKIFVESINHQFQADLIDLRNLSRLNDNYKYILTVIDIFSKYAWVIPLKKKDGKSVRDGLDTIFKQQQPAVLQTDRGTEFKNPHVQKMLREYDIRYFTTHNTLFKCALVERFNRTLKSKMFKMFTSTGKKRYIDKLQDLVKAYNSSKHRTIKMRPIDVNNRNSKEVFYNTYGVATPREYLLLPKSRGKIRIGERVRRKYELHALDKSYYPLWSDMIYIISGVVPGRPVMYRIKDQNGMELPQKFYAEELQTVFENDYRVEKIVSKRKRNGIDGYIVKWLNYPSSYNSWVAKTDIWTLPDGTPRT